jgi:hypothetical protein
MSDRVLLGLDVELETPGRGPQDIGCRGYDLGPDAVTRQNDNAHDDSLAAHKCRWP